MEVFYLSEMPGRDEGSFLREERALLDSLARQTALIIERKRFDLSLRAANQQLEAGNQRLRAKEEQLRDANSRLCASEQKLQRLVTAHQQGERIARIGFFERNWQTGEGNWSAGFWHLLGLEPSSSAQSHGEFMRFVHEEDAERVAEHVQTTLGERRPMDIEFRLVQSDGRVVEIRGIAENHYDEAGRPLLTRGTFQDITARKRSEQALARRQSQQKALYQGARAALSGVSDK